MTARDPLARSFGALERARVRAQIARVEPVLWIEMLAIAGLAGAFLFWQIHIRLAAVAGRQGVDAATEWLVLLLCALVVTGAGQIGARHFVRLRSGEGPPWLALPIPERALSRHLASTSRLQGWWLIAPATSFLVAAAGVVPTLWLPVLALAFVAALDLAGRAACRVALAIAAARARRRHLPAITRVLASEGARKRVRRYGAVRWERVHAPLAVVWNDLRLARRHPAARRRAATAALAIALSWSAWALPIELAGRYLLATGAALLAAATVAEWLIATIGADPADVVRALPMSIRGAWGVRVLWGVAAGVVLALGQLLASGALGQGARAFLVFTILVDSLAITTLGVNYGVSLYPRADQAQRILALTLGLAMAGSLMMPFMGWIVLFTGLIHSSRRVARWSRAEVR